MQSNAGFIYLVCEREFLSNGLDIYKIGMTENILKRMSQYPKGSQLLLALYTNDVKFHERFLIDKFCMDFKARVDIGREYFQGDVACMIQSICNYINSKRTFISLHSTNVPDVKKDNSIIIMEFVDESRDSFSLATLKSKDVYNSFIKWANNKDYLNFVTHLQFTKELKSSFGVVDKAHRFPSGVDKALIFPNLLPSDEDIEKTSLSIVEFVQEYIVKDKDCHFTLKQAKQVFVESKYFNGVIKTLKNDLIKCLQTPCIESKRINGYLKRYVFIGFKINK